MRRAFLDSNVFLYATGSEHPYRDPCAHVLRALRAAEFRGESSVEVAQEACHVRYRRTGDRQTAAALGAMIARSCDLHALEASDLRLALDLFQRAERLSVRDAIHAATAINHGIDLIVSTDGDFDELEQLTRVDPVNTDALAKLVS